MQYPQFIYSRVHKLSTIRGCTRDLIQVQPLEKQCYFSKKLITGNRRHTCSNQIKFFLGHVKVERALLFSKNLWKVNLPDFKQYFCLNIGFFQNLQR